MIVLLATLAAVASVGGAPIETPRRPNVVLVYADDVGWGDLACYGNPVVRTPRLDRFAAEGMRLTACYAGAPHCSPSRASLLTGRISYRTGVYEVIAKGWSELDLRESERTLAELLRDAGYETAHFGKWHLSQARASERPALQHGFDVTRFQNLGLDLAREFRSWLEARKAPDRPFFAYIAPTECHEPVDKRSPPAFQELYEGTEELARGIRYPKRRPRARWEKRNVYYGCVSELDAAFGEILDALEAAGVRGETFIYFSSDNGPERRNVHSWGSTGPFRGGKETLFEGGIRVPGLLQWPGGAGGGTVVDTPVGAVDILPTVCQLAGVALPDDRPIDGTSLLPLIEGRPLERETPLFWAAWGSQTGPHCALRSGRWKLLGTYAPIPEGIGVVDYLRTVRFSKWALYDLSEDPRERAELSREKPEVLERLKDRMTALHREVTASGPDADLSVLRYRARAPEQEAPSPPEPRRPARDG